MAGFGADVTIPDGTKMSPGESFTKTWRLKNTGECTWDAGYDVVFDNGASMGGPASQQLTTGTVLPDASVDISIDMIAPGNTGTYRGDWKLRNPAGVIFGLGLNHQTFFVEIEVVEPTLSPTVTTESTTTHTPSPTTTPEPVIYSSGSLDVDQTFGADLDEGQIASGGVVDFYFQPVNVSTKYVTPLNGALFANWDPVLPSYTQCLNYSLSGADILVEPQLVGYYLCYQTSEGRPGFLHIETITSGDPQTINLNFTTYVAP
jgi:hypothetical protein